MCICSLTYPACSAHAPYYIVICGLSDSTVFFHIVSWTAWFLEKKECVFQFSVQLLFKTIFILRRIQQNIINVCRSSCKMPVILARFLIDFWKILKISYFMKICPVGAELCHADRQSGGQTWLSWIVFTVLRTCLKRVASLWNCHGHIVSPALTHDLHTKWNCSVNLLSCYTFKLTEVILKCKLDLCDIQGVPGGMCQTSGECSLC